MTFEELMMAEMNYQCITTFWMDFSIADRFGIAAIKDTFRRAFKEWKSNYKYLTELILVLNRKSWLYYDKGDMEKSQVYIDLQHQAQVYAENNLKDEEYQYYYNWTD